MTVLSRIADVAARIIGSEIPASGLSAADLAYALRRETIVSQRDKLYAFYQDVYLGLHPDPRLLGPDDTLLTLIGRARTFVLAHNYCGRAIDALVERLDITAWDAGDEALGKAAWGWWLNSDGPELQNTVHAMASVCGDRFLMVDWDAERGMPRFTDQDAALITPVYDAHGRMVSCFKVWTETEYDERGQVRSRVRLTKYTDAVIEKWINAGDGWRRHGDDRLADGMPDGGVIDWTDARGRPLGIPLIAFANHARGQDFGRSELADLVAPQGEINRRVWATSEAMAYQGAQQVAIIDAITTGPDGKPAAPKRGPGIVWTVTSQAKDGSASIVTIPAGDVAAMEAATRAAIKRFAEIAGVPLHLLTMEGNPPSGEALKVAEAPLTGKAADRITTYTGPWSRAMTLAARLDATFGRGRWPDDARIAPVWASVYSRSELSDEQRIALAKDDLSWAERMRLRGYSGDEIAGIKEERDAEEAAMPEPIAPVVAMREGEDERDG